MSPVFTKKDQGMNGKRLLIFSLVLAVCLAAFCFGWGYRSGRKTAEQKIEVVVRDTTIIDTVFREVPKLISSRVVDTMVVHVPVYQRDTLIVTDSVAVRLPLEQREYGDDSVYHAWVSGFRPRLDSIVVFRPIEVRTYETTITQKTRWGIGIQAGYGAYVGNSQVHLAPYVGIGVSYNLFSWNFGKVRPRRAD